jgi:hypothetical protein
MEYSRDFRDFATIIAGVLRPTGLSASDRELCHAMSERALAAFDRRTYPEYVEMMTHYERTVVKRNEKVRKWTHDAEVAERNLRLSTKLLKKLLSPEKLSKARTSKKQRELADEISDLQGTRNESLAIIRDSRDSIEAMRQPEKPKRQAFDDPLYDLLSPLQDDAVARNRDLYLEHVKRLISFISDATNRNLYIDLRGICLGEAGIDGLQRIPRLSNVVMAVLVDDAVMPSMRNAISYLMPSEHTDFAREVLNSVNVATGDERNMMTIDTILEARTWETIPMIVPASVTFASKTMVTTRVVNGVEYKSHEADGDKVGKFMGDVERKSAEFKASLWAIQENRVLERLSRVYVTELKKFERFAASLGNGRFTSKISKDPGGAKLPQVKARLIVLSGTIRTTGQWMSRIYEKYISRGVITQEEREELLNACLELKDVLTTHGALRQNEQYDRKPIRYVYMHKFDYTDEGVTGTSAQFLSVTEAINYIYLTLDQLSAQLPEGLYNLAQDPLAPKMTNYGMTQQSGDTKWCVNPFFPHLYYVITFPAQGHGSKYMRVTKFIDHVNGNEEFGHCIRGALFYQSPTPLSNEFDGTLDSIHSIPWMKVTAVNDDHTWCITEASAGYGAINPSEVNLATMIVLYEENGHMSRVVNIRPPCLKLATTEGAERTQRIGKFICWAPCLGKMTHEMVSILEDADVHQEVIRRVLASKNIAKTLCSLYEDADFKASVGYINMTKWSEDRRNLGLPVIQVVKIEGSHLVLLHSTDSSLVEYEELMEDHERFAQVITIVKSGGHCYRIVNYELDCDAVHIRQRGYYGVKLYDSFIDMKRDIKDFDVSKCSTIEDVCRCESIPWILIKPTSNKSSASGIHAYNATKVGMPRADDKGCPLIDFESTLVIWQGNDDELGIVTGLCDHYISMSKEKDTSPKKTIHMAYDCETKNFNSGTRGEKVSPTRAILWAVVWSEGDVKKSKTFEGYDCSRDFIEWLYQFSCEHENDHIILWGYNSARFDAYQLYAHLMQHKSLEYSKMRTWNKQNGDFIKSGAKIIKFGCNNLEFKDTRCFLAGGSLKDNAAAFECKGAKTGWRHDKDQEFFETLRPSVKDDRLWVSSYFEALKKEPLQHFSSDVTAEESTLSAYEGYVAYCINDCEVTLELTLKIRAVLLEITDGRMDITDRLTIPQAVYKYNMTIMRENKYVPFRAKCEPKRMERLLEWAILAGRSECFATAPTGKFTGRVGDSDETSQYPFSMQEGLYPVGDQGRWVDAFIPNKLGVYVIHVKKQSSFHIFPLKPKDWIVDSEETPQLETTLDGEYIVNGARRNTLQNHCWDFSEEFVTATTSVHLLMFWRYGGECKVLHGYVFERAQRGIMAETVNRFKNIKMHQDVLASQKKAILAMTRAQLEGVYGKDEWEKKASKVYARVFDEQVVLDETLQQEFERVLPLIEARFQQKERYNPAKRDLAKLILNSLSGKFLQRPNLEHILVFQDFVSFKQKQDELVANAVKEGIDLESFALIDKTNEAMQVSNGCYMLRYKNTYDSVFLQKGRLKKAPKSRAVGLFIYAWSQYHITTGLLQRVHAAGAAFATETDSVHFDMEKYEKYCESHGIVNPYDVSAPNATSPWCGDATLRAPNSGHESSYSDHELGYYYCPTLAANYAKRKGLVWQPSHLPTFGDFTSEISTEYKETSAYFVNKKVWWESNVEKFGNKAHGACKGIGASTRLLNIEPISVSDSEETKQWKTDSRQLLIGGGYDLKTVQRVITRPGMFEDRKPWSPEFFDRVANGYGVDVVEKRFQGSLSALGDDGCHMHNVLVTKRICPSDKFFLVVRTTEQPVEQILHPGSSPKGKPSLNDNDAMVMFHGQLLGHDTWSEVYGEIKKKSGDPLFMRGATIATQELGNVYVKADTLRFIMANTQYFNTQ